jgi:acyl-[acyl-carrier-protein]-phospholipid O-acyltransferase/long-chain-fatty-acid--[acyl-carrier-protein] ligase
MSTAVWPLLRSRRFAPLFVTQFLGAFNDNLLKSGLAIFVTYRLATAGGMEASTLVMLAGAIFIAPFFLFSGASGTLADRVDKAKIARWVKIAEIFIMATGAAGFATASVPLLLIALFGLGTHSTVFGPIKYALLPEHLADHELVAGNALIEAGTFLAILFGTILGGSLMPVHNGALIVGILGVAVALIGWGSARFIPLAPPSSTTVARPRLFHDSIDVVKHVAARDNLFKAILALSWFWLIGGTLVSGLPVFAKDVLFADEQVVTLMLATFAIGVALGSFLAERMLHGEVSARFVPGSALAMAVFAFDLFLSSTGREPSTSPATIGMFVAQPANWRVLADLFGLAVAGGIFTVPLYALLQHESEPEHRARVIAANNIINSIFMTASAVLAALVLAKGLTMGELFGLCGILTVPVVVVAAWVLRKQMLKMLFRAVLRALYRVEVHGLEHARAAQTHTVIAANHASFLDAMLLGAFLPGTPVFAIDTYVAKLWWVRPFLSLVDAIPVDPTNPLSLRAMIRAVESGASCIIFPEGRLTTTGSLMKVYEGPAVITERSKAQLLPVRIEGVERTPFARYTAVRRRWFPKIRITVMAPRRLEVPEGVVGRAKRALLRSMLRDIMVDIVFKTARLDMTLFDGLLDARAMHGSSHVAIDDIEFSPMTYGRLVTASLALGGALARRTRDGERVGVLLPTSRAAVVTFFGLQATNRVPAMLNFSAGPASVGAACTAAEVRVVITARRFIEKAKLDALIAALSAQTTIVYLEDVRKEIGIVSRVSAAIRSAFARPGGHSSRANEPAVVLFTSGSEGTPKGVVLSHRNLLANRHQLASVVDVNPKDIVLNALPVFHSFGLTGGLLLPLLAGVKTFLYPSPLHYRTVPELAYGINATILFGTDTFLAGYARVADNYDFYSVRYVFAGAERVKEQTRKAWFEKFGIRILEGYGATETAPGIAVNTPMHFKAGTVGRLLPGIDHRVEAVPGVEASGRLFVAGPNVMLGYLKVEAPGVLQPPPDGWYDTGDIVDIDNDGFVTIKGRIKRFAKIAGEMVPLGGAEDLANKAYPKSAHAVVSLPDPRKGERLVLLTVFDGVERAHLAATARDMGMPEIFVPRVIVHVKAIPLLGTGKTDYVEAARLAAAQAEGTVVTEAEPVL